MAILKSWTHSYFRLSLGLGAGYLIRVLPNMKRSLVILLVAGIFLAAMSFRFSHRRDAERHAREAAWLALKADREAELKSLREQAHANLPIVLPPPLPGDSKPAKRPSSAPAPEGQAQPVVAATPTAEETAAALASALAEAAAAQAAANGKAALQDPLAREALSMVGMDEQAEAIWAAAINNPDLPANERKDLIEDLNEDGFPDPKNPTIEDLPLIVSRLGLIEDYAAEAIDNVNWQAFMEAYKDLLNMYVRLTAQEQEQPQ